MKHHRPPVASADSPNRQPNHVDRLRRLAAAVLVRAIEDASGLTTGEIGNSRTKAQREARAWLASPGCRSVRAGGWIV